MRLPTVLMLLLVCITTSSGEKKEKVRPQHYNIILIGATGDLAQKYLWRGLFDLFSQTYVKEKVQFLIYGCARKSPDEGRKLLSQILLNTIKCHDVECREMKKSFVEAIQYHQLKTAAHYKELDSKVSENTKGLYAMLDADWTYEVGRLIYLSIPPSQYPKTIELVHKNLRPRIARNVWVRLVLEKPFGADLDSARDLAITLSQHFKEEEIFRIDHYLGKTVVKQILPFRYVNREAYEPLWNSHHVDRVEIVMKEKVDVKGRTAFYDEVGVLRDVMQNHLTELLCLVAMELPKDSGNIAAILASKKRLLRQVEAVSEQSVLMAQYSSYHREFISESKSHESLRKTPTFAATLLKVNNARWKGTPFILMSGKKLEEKAGYVRIVFKDNAMCMSATKNCREMKQLIFYIGDSDHRHAPMVIASEGLPSFADRPAWKSQNLKLDLAFFGQSINETRQLIPDEDDDAYTNLIQAVFQGQRHLFVDTDSLLASWEIWTRVIRMTSETMPRIYHGTDIEPELLEFHLTNGGGLKFDIDQDVIHIDDPKHNKQQFAHIPATFRGHRLVSGPPRDLVQSLASDIYSLASASISSRDVFHIALSGGRSPIQLLKTLASPDFYTFPWQQTHVWFVDERCVNLTDTQSNFNTFQTHVLNSINIPHLNVHPMPVQLSEELCANDGDLLYESSINLHIKDHSFDFILLGVGTDGHTASLFPNQTSLLEVDHLVTYADGGPKSSAFRRMTLTFAAINRARSVGILVTGSGKHNVIETLSSNNTDPVLLPIAGVKPMDGNLTWYIDHDAYLGKDLF